MAKQARKDSISAAGRQDFPIDPALQIFAEALVLFEDYPMTDVVFNDSTVRACLCDDSPAHRRYTGHIF